MLYTRDHLTQLLRRMQSLDYPRYERYQPVDVLLDLLRWEQICDYRQVEWKDFWQNLYKDRKYNIPWGDTDNYSIVLGKQLEHFCDQIIGKAETVRLLTFFREHAAESVFHGDTCTNIDIFTKECALLIYIYTNERCPDEYHGYFATMPHPDLRRIALGDGALPKLNKEEQIIAKYIPTYPHDVGAFHKENIIRVAQLFVADFRRQADAFRRTNSETDKPNMKQTAYKIPIRDELIRAENRIIYFEEEPIYQVLWVMTLLMRLPRKSEWWEDHFAQSTLDYLNCTKHFANQKIAMDKAINDIRALTEPSLGLFDELPLQQNECAKPHKNKLTSDQLVKQLATELIDREKLNEKLNINIKVESLALGDNVQQKIVYGNE